MHIERIHKMIEKLTECALCELDKGAECVNTKEFGEVVDMIKDLSESEYKSLISKEMKEYKEEEEAEEKYMMRKLKEDYKDEYKRMREEYGEEDGERRFYDNYRYKSTGRFAPKGRGSYMPKRGYEEPPYYRMTPEMMREHDPEYWRDVDRASGKMYYTSGNTGTGASDSGNMNSGNVRGYEEGYNDGNRRGYSEGYDKGSRDGRSMGDNSRYDRARRGYEEKKMMHNGNTPEDNKENMKGLEELLNVVGGDIKELSPNMSPSEKAMTAQKFDTWAKMLKQ